MPLKETPCDSTHFSIDSLVGAQDPNVSQYLFAPQNPLYVQKINSKDIDGAELAIVRKDPYYGSPCHIVRTQNGSYAQFAAGQIIGDVFERKIDGKFYICVDQGTNGISVIDPRSQTAMKETLSMTGKIRLEAERSGVIGKIKSLL